MLARAGARLLVLTAVLAMAAPAAAGAPPTSKRIVAVGDLHGDFAAWRAIAKAAGLVDDRGRWHGGQTVLVQVGDVVDRGPDSLRIIEDLMRLQREARRRGGSVIALVGNHEAMNVTGDLRYVSAADYAAFVDRQSEQRREDAYKRTKSELEAAYRKQDPAMTEAAIKQAVMAATPLGMIEHQTAWSPQGRIGRWVVANPAVALIDGVLFVHGGLCGPYTHLPVEEINRQVAAALAVRATAPDSIINDVQGPLWCRRLAGIELADSAAAEGSPPAQPPPAAPGAAPAPTAAAPVVTPPPVTEQLDQILPAHGAKRIVIGHTPVLSGIAVLHEGRLARIDTGISAAIGGKLTYLELVGDTLTPHVVDRPPPGP
jgi:hypothetical protein